MENPKVIKITPYKGLNDEVFEGTKTKITLSPDKLEYKIKFKQKNKVSKVSDEDEVREVVSFVEEEGVILKDSIIGILKYIETDYKEDLTPVIIHYVDICSDANALTFSMDDEESKNSLYQDLYDWKFRKD